MPPCLGAQSKVHANLQAPVQAPEGPSHKPACAPQFCQCLPGLRQASAGVVKGLWRIQCVPEKDRNVATLIIFTVLGVAVAAAVAAVLALVIMRNRHALGPPGQPTCRICPTVWICTRLVMWPC